LIKEPLIKEVGHGKSPVLSEARFFVASGGDKKAEGDTGNTGVKVNNEYEIIRVNK
jgi:hypothetical protein